MPHFKIVAQVWVRFGFFRRDVGCLPKALQNMRADPWCHR